MKKDVNEIVDQHLSVIEGMQEIGPDPFFYTRLKARMDKENETASWDLPFKPVWVIGILITLLALNGILIVQESRSTKTNAAKGIQALAASYDQVVSD
ncbi:MAG: hypothetical protein WCH78_13295 [Bacteroidota bacterium]|jgi:hypothetical protein